MEADSRGNFVLRTTRPHLNIHVARVLLRERDDGGSCIKIYTCSNVFVRAFVSTEKRNVDDFVMENILVVFYRFLGAGSFTDVLSDVKNFAEQGFLIPPSKY